MINEKTVFVLGAGASYPYGYPIGKELRRQICLNFENQLTAILENDQLLLAKQNITSHAKKFTDKFYHSSNTSIDLFLARNQQYSDIGRIAIALNILRYEKHSKFREKLRNQSQDWYFYLFNRMTRELTAPDSHKDFKKNDVAFITFNYDRSLEYFMHDSFLNSFTKMQKGINESIIPFPFLHVYGVIEQLHWQSNKYGSEYRDIFESYKNLERLKNNIKLIHDVKKSIDSNIRPTLHNAKRIFFLGFGYHKENMEILNIPDILNLKQEIYGTALGFTDKEIKDIKKQFPTKTVKIENIDCVELLREYL